jgi:pilus assembly protein Flp/PilA
VDMDAVDRVYSRKEGLSMAAVVQRLICEEEGQGLTEYAIIVAAIALLVVGALSALGSKVRELFEVPFPTLE